MITELPTKETASITSEADLHAFLGKNFVQPTPYNLKIGYMRQYAPFTLEHLRNRFPHRMENPNYIKLVKGTFMRAAEYGFPEVLFHAIRHDRRDWQRDYMDPRHLLALFDYLCSINRQAVLQKIDLLSQWNGVVPPGCDIDEFWARWVRPKAGKVILPPAERFIRETNHSRVVFKLPLYKPDLDIITRAKNLDFNGDRADQISLDEFQGQVLPVAESVFAGIVPDLASVFLDPNERWRQ